jgi:hypothetical protein
MDSFGGNISQRIVLCELSLFSFNYVELTTGLNDSDFTMFSFSYRMLFFSPFCYYLKIRYVIFRVFVAFVILKEKEKMYVVESSWEENGKEG